jgi:hypothetical protein
VLEDLQRIADQLARRLRRAVAIDDLGLRLLVYTAHMRDVDRVRTSVVFTRQAPPEAAAWVRRFQITRSTGPIRIPANDDIGFLPRVCVPVRHRGLHFGWLWLIDPDESLSPADLELAVAAADEAGRVLFLENISKDYRQARDGELLRDLLSDEESQRKVAADELIEESRFTSDPDVVVVVGRPRTGGGAPLSAAARAGLGTALARAVTPFPTAEALRLVRADHALVVVRTSLLDAQPAFLADLQRTATDAMKTAGEPSEVLVGVGPGVALLSDAHLSYRGAMQAVRVAAAVSDYAPIAQYHELGVYGPLAAMPLDELTRSVLHPAVLRLVEDPDLRVTLELFLDLAGDTKRVADQLHLHRSTVYYRLRRIETVCGVDLDDGRDRLTLHLALKVARLRGEELSG